MTIFSSIARVKPPRFIHAFEDAVEADAKKIAAAAKVDAARCVGYAELLGFRYPVKAYHFKVSETLTRGSRLDAQGLKDLKAQSFKGVVNLCKEHDDSANARAAGLIPLHLAIIDYTVPQEAQMKQFLDFVSDAAHQPCYVHCEGGMGRTGVAVACYRMAVQGWTAEDAVADGRNFGLQLENQIDFLHRFHADLQDGRIDGYPIKS